MDKKNESEQNLRSEVIRLAHSKPHLRKHLLPMLKEASVAQTILKQLGGARRLKAMINASNFIDGGKYLTFKFSMGNKKAFCKITLTSLDLYDMEIFSIRRPRGQKITVTEEMVEENPQMARMLGQSFTLPSKKPDIRKTIAKHDNIYFDQLIELFEKSTKMYLRLAHSTKSANYSEHYRGDTVDVISDIQSACHRAGLECKAYDKKMFGSMIPHIEIIGDRSSIAKVMRKFKTKAVKTAFSKISVDMDAAEEAVEEAVRYGRPKWNVDADYDLRFLQYGIRIKSNIEFVIKGDVSGVHTQRDFGMGERYLIVSDNKGKAKKECEQHAIHSLYSAFEKYDVPFEIVGVRSRMAWFEDTGNGSCSLEITCK